MINDQQVKKLRSDLNGGMRLAAAALRSGMSEKTARKYRNMNQLPSEAQQPYHWRTRIDPFERDPTTATAIARPPSQNHL